MSLDTKMRKVVQRVMRKIGTSVTIRRVNIGSYSTATGTVSTTQADYEVLGRLDDYEDRELNNTIKAGDRRLTFAAADASFVPVVHDKVLIGEELLDIVRVTREMAQHEPAMIVLQIRQ